MFAQLLVFAATPGMALAAANNPPVAPHAINVFPNRDFVSANGYAEGDLAVVKVIHSAVYGGGVISTDPANPIPVGADGLVEVNHPGANCWFTTTPDIRAGDTVEVDIVSGPAATLADLVVLSADATTVANVTVKRAVAGPVAGSVVIHGTAQDSVGAPLDVTQLEARLIAPNQVFDLNGKRMLRAASAPGAQIVGTLAYDAPGSISWTATYSGLTAADVARAASALSIGIWLGSNPAATVESTNAEIGAGIAAGPAAPCTAPLEILPPPPGSELVPPTTPGTPSASLNGTPNTVTLSWTASTDNVGVTSYGVYRNGAVIANVQNLDGSAPAPTTYVDANVPPGTYTYTVDAADEVGNRSPMSGASGSITTTTQVAATVPVSEPPGPGKILIFFPSRDFISSTGFAADETVSVEIIRDGLVISSADGVIPQDDPTTPQFEGLVEVNHPGGACWAGITPEIRTGDKLRMTAYAPDGTVRTIDQITTANVVANKAVVVRHESAAGANDGIVEVHGTAIAHDGSLLPVDQIDNRLIASTKDPFDLTGKRTIRAASALGTRVDGILTYDTANNPLGNKWTAVYTGLDEHDVTLATTTATSASTWLGRDPLVGNELTIYETNLLDPPGPAPASCSSPIEAPDLISPTWPVAATLAPVQNTATSTVQLSWPAASDDWSVYNYLITRDGTDLHYVSGTTLIYTDTNVPAGNHIYTVQALDSASPRGAGPTIIQQLQAGQGNLYGNLSLPLSASISQPDVTAPSVPNNLVALSGPGRVTLNWSASTDDVGVTGYSVYRGGVKIADVTTPTYLDLNNGLGLAIGSYSYTVDAYDAAGNRSVESAPATANVTQVADLVAPTTPTGVAADTRDVYSSALAPAIGPDAVRVRWNASTDNVGVTGYRIYRREGPQVAGVIFPDWTASEVIAIVNGATLSYTDLGLAAGTYAYGVQSFDSAGNALDATAPVYAVTVNDPPLTPHILIPFPQRDYTSGDAYTQAEGPLTVQVIRRGAVVVSSEPILPDTITGLVEVNHPGITAAGVTPAIGGGCWVGFTPDIRPGDIVRYVDVNGVAEQTATAYVFSRAAVQLNANTVQVHGFAMDAAGAPLPIGQLEQRLITGTTNRFDLNGRRQIRAGAAGDGSIAYDTASSIFWTATYTGLTAADVTRSLGAQSAVLWLGRNPLPPVESTIYEDGAIGGPAAGFCNAPSEPRPNATLSTATLAFGNQRINTTSAARSVTLTNNSALPLAISQIVLAPGSRFTVSATTCAATLLAGRSCTISLTFNPLVTGNFTGTLYVMDDAFNSPAQVVDLTGTGVAPVATLSVASLSFGSQAVNVASAAQSFTLTNTGNGALTVSSIAITQVSTDFAISANTCPVSPTSIAAGASCTISVRFTPRAAGARTGTLNVVSDATNGTQSVALSGTGVAVPAAPTGVSATAGNAQATISWTAVAGATSYNVKRATRNGGPYTTVGTSTTTSFINTGLTNGTTYFYVVTAVNAAGESVNSTQVTVTPVAPPAAPTGPSATAGNNQVTVSWTAAAGATSYNVKRSTTSGGPYTTIANVTAGTSFVNTGLTNGTTYFYIVTAANAGGESANSAQVSATPAPTPPAAPTGLTATAGARGTLRIALSWTASAGATSYTILRGTTRGGPYTTTVATGVTTTTFTNTGLTNGTTYFYVVRAVNAAGTSGNSNEASARAQ